ncbi:FecR family protein [Chitinophaga silvisoli]|uniref:FecR family protein n=1 Tax=Chitinophaga silvisoli TaxID=2291814 RepID=A0A3E1NWJ1_9BACT|nr:FecR family protein [Chitinophaga silvisoli]RFM32280.1 FecR family protein [Chitinophaga silvisoli]
MSDEQIIHLIHKYRNGTLTETEELAFFSWYAEVGSASFHRILQQAGEVDYVPASPAFLSSLEERLQHKKAVVRKMPILRRAAAAAAIILLGTTAWYVFKPQRRSIPPIVAAKVNDVQPGKNGAVLTLANGQVIALDSTGNGVIANQNGTTVTLQNGSLRYNAEKAAATSYNMIRTPNARQFKLVLPDGTTVWLNAGSSLKYPTAFNGRERIVTISGEAFFDVAKDAEHPFVVEVADQLKVQVLGTQFNLNAYTDEKQINATLIQGSIRVNKGASAVVLQPGQQAQVNDGITVNSHINTAQVTAWKDGVFNFDDLGVEAVMRQLARWYDIEVVYEQGIPGTRFYGEIGRNLSLAQVLEGLKLSGVHFKIEGKRLIVLP